MANDATTQLSQGAAQTETEIAVAVLMAAVGNYVGAVASLFQIFGISFDLFPSPPKESDAPILAQISQQLDSVLALAAANASDVKMAELNTYAISADSDLVTIANSVTGTIDPTTAISFQKDSIAFVTAASDPQYWTRPFLVQLSFLPEAIVNSPPEHSGVPAEHSWSWYGNLPQPLAQPGIFPMVLDPQLAQPYFLKAIQAFLAINALLNPKGFHQFIEHYNTSPGDFLPTVANNLKQFYTTLVNGLVKSDVPTTNDIISYLNAWELIPNVGPPVEPFCAGAAQNAGHPPLAFSRIDPTTVMDKSGCCWNGVYGVVDMFGTFIDRRGLSPPGTVGVPARETFFMVDIFTENGVRQLPTDHPFLPGHTPYRWARDRITLGLMARWKAIYMLRNYHRAWSVLQSLRLILGEPPDDRLTLTDGTTASEHWSARELISVLQLRPLLAYIDPAGGDYVPQEWYSVFHLVQRLDLIGRGNWATPMDDDFFDHDEWMNRTVVTQRPVSFRDRLAVAAV
jgi:hypothetical protein